MTDLFLWVGEITLIVIVIHLILNSMGLGND